MCFGGIVEILLRDVSQSEAVQYSSVSPSIYSPLYVDYELLTFICSYLPKTVRLQRADEPLVKLGGVIAFCICIILRGVLAPTSVSDVL